MNILFLTVGDEKHPSSQVRVYQFLPYFRNMGIKCTVRPFLSIETRLKIAPELASKNIFKAAKAICILVLALLKRLGTVITAYSYSAILVQKDVLPFGLQTLLHRINPNIIFEFDDAIWELPPQFDERPAIIRFFYPYKIRLFHKMLKRAKSILANNSYQADYAIKLNKKVDIITAPIDTALYKPSDNKDSDKVVLGWVGSPSTVYMLKDIFPALEKLGNKYLNLELHNIGGEPIELKNIKVQNIKWENDKIQNNLTKLDIGLMPLDDEPINRGRLGYKMIIYMSLGIPFVAQDIGLNRSVVKNGVNGYLAGNEDEWVEKLSRLIEDRELRNRLGKNGRKIAVEEYDIKEQAKKYANLFYEIAKK